MTAGNDTHTQREGVEFLIVERYVSNNHTPIMNLKRHTCVCVCVSLCVHSSQGYFVRPITLRHQTVQGAGREKETPVLVLLSVF